MTSVVNPLDLLPHRYPFLLLDRIEVVTPGQEARGRKLVTGSEWQLVGSRDGVSSLAMPHALIVEALARVGEVVLVNAVLTTIVRPAAGVKA